MMDDKCLWASTAAMMLMVLTLATAGASEHHHQPSLPRVVVTTGWVNNFGWPYESGWYGGWNYTPRPQIYVVPQAQPQATQQFYPLPRQQQEHNDRLPHSTIRSPEEVKLNRLKDFHERGVITDEEYTDRRRAILGSM